MTREAALRLNVFSRFSYTIETIIQAGLSNLRIVNVPVRVNGPTRPSRLFKGNLSYIRRSIVTMLSVYLIYRPTYLFGFLSVGFLAPGLLLGIRYLALRMLGEGLGHVQSVIACAILLVCGVFMAAIGVVAYLLSINRRLMEELRYLARSQRSERDHVSEQWQSHRPAGRVRRGESVRQVSLQEPGSSADDRGVPAQRA
jgi:hypothetical protein